MCGGWTWHSASTKIEHGDVACSRILGLLETTWTWTKGISWTESWRDLKAGCCPDETSCSSSSLNGPFSKSTKRTESAETNARRTHGTSQVNTLSKNRKGPLDSQPQGGGTEIQANQISVWMLVTLLFQSTFQTWPYQTPA